MTEYNLSSPSEIKNIMTRHGFHFSKSLGQNFLINNSVCPRMAENCNAGHVTGVLEIGPGIGVLTYELAKTARKVVSVELDKKLLPVLEETLGDCENVEVVSGDIMKMDISSLINEKLDGGPISVCANLPYYITSPVIMNLLESNLPIKSITVMVQKEAAKRLSAIPGSADCGAISVGVHYRAVTEILFEVGRGSFMPPPNVDSAVMRLDMRDEPPVQVDNEKHFFALVKAAFGQRRKTLVNSVSSLMGIEKKVISDGLLVSGINQSIRAERMTIEQFAVLSNYLERNV